LLEGQAGAFVALHPNTLPNVTTTATVKVNGCTVELPVQRREDVAEGVVALPVGMAGLAYLPLHAAVEVL
jgi:hypothetical protein